MIQRKKANSSKINLTISVVFHSLLFGVVLFLAAREGILGKKLKMITVTMVPKEKKPEPPKEKPPEPKAEQPKPAEAPKVMAAAPPRTQAPPPSEAPPAVAPAAAEAPAFEFNDGAKAVETVSDPSAVYKGLIEHSLRSHWDRPEDMQDEAFVVEVELPVDASGQLGAYHWLKGSGNTQWDNSVKAALAKTSAMSRPPPKGFPAKFTVRFDVESLRTESAIEVSSR